MSVLFACKVDPYRGRNICEMVDCCEPARVLVRVYRSDDYVACRYTYACEEHADAAATYALLASEAVERAP